MITKESIKDFPAEPGIYIFSKNTKPIYIGKSVNIKTRVLSHIRQAALSKKEHAIISNADKVDYVTTLSNFDAILLEADLIKKHRPKYNVISKDDKNYLYIKITTKDPYPKIFPVRNENDGKSKYFGPFGSTKMTHSLIYELRRITPFCTNRKIAKKGCFYSKIGLCDPCPNNIEKIDDSKQKKEQKKQYRRNIDRAINLLSGKSHRILRDLERKLESHVKKSEFEEAIIVRDKLLNFTLFLERRSFRRDSFSTSLNKDELHNEVQKFLEKYFKHDIDKRNYRIECYDISNLQGTFPTGSMVVNENGSLAKKEYKKFSVRLKGISDIHMMKEVIKRRLNHMEWGKPDLMVLDGGKPQLRMIQELFDDEGITIPLISIAKRPDRILVSANGYKPVSLKKEMNFYKLIQSLRDESHRFAKKYHVLLRNRNRLN